MYRTHLSHHSYQFPDLRTLMAKATPARSGDYLAGVAAGSAEEAKEAFRRLTRESEGEYAIIYVEENLARDLEHEIARYKDVPSPAIIFIPGREGPLGLGQAALKAAVEKAVGTDIL